MTQTQRNIFRLVISFFIGAFILLNQFGFYINKHLDISFLNQIWEVNIISSVFSIELVFTLSLLLIAIHFLALRVNPILKSSFSHGLLSGFFVIPLLAIAIGIVGGILWIITWLFKKLQIIFSFIAIPLIWLFKNILEPVFEFIGIPFIWLWVNILKPIIAFIGIPFVWLWENVLQPVIAFIGIPFIWLWVNILQPFFMLLYSYLLKPLFLILIIVFLGLFVLLPFVLVGIVMMKIMRDTLVEPFTPNNVFGYGIGLGFFFFEMVGNYFLFYYGISNIHPSLVALFPLLLGSIFIVRFYFFATKDNILPVPYKQNLSIYWETSRLDLAVTACLIPLGIAIAILNGQDQ